jgi:hypothetical protein
VVVTWWEEDDQAALLIAAQERSERKSDFKKREAERAAKDAIVNLFYAAAEEMKHWYGLRDSEPYALNKAIAAARNQVTLNQSFIDQRRKDYGEDLRLPRHYGFERLAILAEQEHRFDDGIALCEQAESEGWPGDWQKRIDRMSVKKRKTS